ncbi:hypothetical protein FIBSPDRAFT_421909 [Athelia psychrophila]|uniref:Biotin carboxylase-like N-terminal domain-containing protein n=1 Tax=Athelia psychrophila TaxID=1759441 RepID=A0A166MUZ7_9AGAM|nr:hypothetical protein FIBSPDRAFT_421909 [Fibularhizoctonia sp. CBS 109695]
MSPERIVDIAKRTQSTHIRPGYGFLSEGSALASLPFSPKLGRPNGSPYPTLCVSALPRHRRRTGRSVRGWHAREVGSACPGTRQGRSQISGDDQGCWAVGEGAG